AHRAVEPADAHLHRSAGDPGVGERLLARTPSVLEPPEQRLIEIGAAQVENAMPALAAPLDRRPQEQVVRVELRVPLVARAVLVYERPVMRTEHRRSNGDLAAVR